MCGNVMEVQNGGQGIDVNVGKKAGSVTLIFEGDTVANVNNEMKAEE